MNNNSLLIDTQVAELVLTRFLVNEINKAGFRRAVIGLSSSIDSALSCALTSAALGPENVLAYRMPHKTSSSEILEHAQLVIDEFGVKSETIDITQFVDPLISAYPEMGVIRRGDIIACIRMVLLYDRSAAAHAFVIGSSNKSELLLGLGTLFGDLASSVNPLGDLYKTQVCQLAEYMGVPKAIISKELSADLAVDQFDQAGLNTSFAEVDRLLYLLIDERYSPKEAVVAGFDNDFVHQVLTIVNQSHYKRVLPIIPKLSGRTIGHDFRYLRDTGL